MADAAPGPVAGRTGSRPASKCDRHSNTGAQHEVTPRWLGISRPHPHHPVYHRCPAIPLRHLHWLLRLECLLGEGGNGFCGGQQLPETGLRPGLPRCAGAHAALRVLGGRHRVHPGLLPGPIARQALPGQGHFPHDPRPAADGRPDRGRRHLAAVDDPGLRAGPVLPGQMVRHKLQHRPLCRPGLPDRRAHGHLALDPVCHAGIARRAHFHAGRAFRAGQGGRRQPVADRSATSPSPC